MEPQPVFSDELVAKLVNNNNLEGGLIENMPAAKITPINRVPALSSLGLIGLLPRELHHEILNQLDFQSLSRVSRTSLGAKQMVEALPAYAEMVQHASKVLVALGRSKMLPVHSASLLRKTLRTRNCVSCFGFAGLVLLPTCERVCTTCLEECCFLRVIAVDVAKTTFKLTDEQVGQLPLFRSVPGPRKGSLPKFPLVNLRQAKRLAVSVHGSIEAVEKFESPLKRCMPSDVRETFSDPHDYIRKASLEPMGCDLSRQPGYPRRFQEGLTGIASTRMPYLSETGADPGRVCKGCHLLYRRHRCNVIDFHLIEAVVPSVVLAERALAADTSRLRAEEEFAEHIKICYGVKLLLDEWKKHEEGRLTYLSHVYERAGI